MRQRKLKRLWKRLHELHKQRLSRDDVQDVLMSRSPWRGERDQLLKKLGAAKKVAGQFIQ